MGSVKKQIAAQPRESRDITNAVDVSNPTVVCGAVAEIMDGLFAEFDIDTLAALFDNFEQLYTGNLPGFHACDTLYHDIQHVLDVTLAMARLIDGYQRSVDKKQQLTADKALLGLAVALYHDSGYIRRKGDSRHQNGAEYTRIHVSRSARYMAEYFPETKLSWATELAIKLVHFTGYEVSANDIQMESEVDQNLGYLIGTADVIAQMSDIAYLEKCRDRLYPEFEQGGLTRNESSKEYSDHSYTSPEDLLLKTPVFIKDTIAKRLDGLFCGMYRYAGVHFGGRNLYMEALENNCRHLEKLLAKNDLKLLQQQRLRAPEVI